VGPYDQKDDPRGFRKPRGGEKGDDKTKGTRFWADSRNLGMGKHGGVGNVKAQCDEGDSEAFLATQYRAPVLGEWLFRVKTKAP